MAAKREKAALVTLLRQGHRPWQLYADLIEEAGSATAVLEQEGIQDDLFGASGIERSEAEIAGWEADGIQLVSILDERYPENLRAVYDRPPMVFVSGTLSATDARSVAVIGSRNASDSGIAAATAIADHLGAAGYTVLSGLAAGIDTAAHRAALARGTRTVAVIGTGLRHAYPPQNSDLQRLIAQRCAVVSQFWPDAPPTRRSFPMRNAVMSGIALATVIVEATHTSGARIQSRLALAQGRRVFVLESLLAQEWARELVTRPGTHVVRAPAEITDTLGRVTDTGALVA